MLHARHAAPDTPDWFRPHRNWWQRLFRGQEGELRQVREWLTGLLPDSPARDDLISVAVELGTNAIQHTASGNGGCFTIEVAFLSSVIRVSVTDEGAPSEPRLTEDPLSEHGRGLLIVNALSVTSGVWGNARGRTVWAEIAQCLPPSSALAGQGRSSHPPASSAMAVSRTL